ncbi:serine hydrolase [Spirulina subsalsa]|uniref:serine hydrolase n=1 Tax=Spirulina subsalsa TaxID=54311 RepID=UPI00031D43AF|nr:serine hydrolase [Spirulina subsalsa]
MPFFYRHPHIETLGQQILDATWSRFPNITGQQIAFTWLVYDPPVIVNTGAAIAYEEFWQYPVRGFSYRGTERYYPAHLAQLFYLVAIEEWLSKEMLSTSPELERAIRDMAIHSSHDATSLVIDVLSGTTSGPELSPGPFETWKQQRNIVNRYFQSLGWEELAEINLNQKTWSHGPYGRERCYMGEMMDNRNMLTANAIARLLHSIVGGVAVSSDRAQTMMQMLQRQPDLPLTQTGTENGIQGFLGQGIPPQSHLWSKGGWNAQVRHDAAYIEVSDLQPYLLVVLTEGIDEQDKAAILPFLSQEVLAAMTQIH